MSSFILMGSGETTPTLTPIHREIFDSTAQAVGTTNLRNSFIDTPFGFQLNCDELTSRTQTYFSDATGQTVSAAHWRTKLDPQGEDSLNLLAQSHWVLSGPGSPSYALAQWADTQMPGALVDVALRGGTLILGSAAAVTAGSHSIPVYEIYKAGAAPHWLDGLNLLHQLTGLTAAVIPHYNNAEGGTHDTRYCYLGEHRLATLEQDLPAETGVLGVDEQTALWFDLTQRRARVLGRGGVTARYRQNSVFLPANTSISVEELARALRGAQHRPDSPPATAADQPTPQAPATDSPDSLRELSSQAQQTFAQAVIDRDVRAAAAAILELEQAIADWAHDTLVSADQAAARRILRSLILQLSELAQVGAQDPRIAISPFVTALLELRDQARASRDFATADQVRTALLAAGIEVRDTAEGVAWDMS